MKTHENHLCNSDTHLLCISNPKCDMIKALELTLFMLQKSIKSVMQT